MAPTYDRALGRRLARTKRAFEFVAARYGIRFGSAADVGCGTGLFACYLSRCWRVPVFAVDRSADMLREAACRCRDPKIRFIEQDLRDLRLPCPVDLVTANFDTVNHLLTACDLGQAFRRIAGNLKSGGHFVFDVITRRQAPYRLAYVRRLRATGRKLFQKIRWNPARGLLSITIVQVAGPSPPASNFTPAGVLAGAGRTIAARCRFRGARRARRDVAADAQSLSSAAARHRGKTLNGD